MSNLLTTTDAYLLALILDMPVQELIPGGVLWLSNQAVKSDS